MFFNLTLALFWRPLFIILATIIYLATMTYYFGNPSFILATLHLFWRILATIHQFNNRYLKFMAAMAAVSPATLLLVVFGTELTSSSTNLLSPFDQHKFAPATVSNRMN
jgi:hypothetical protein